MADFVDLIGKTVAEGEDLYPDFTIRVIKVDGRDVVGDCAFLTNRINVGLIDGVIYSLHGIG